MKAFSRLSLFFLVFAAVPLMAADDVISDRTTLGAKYHEIIDNWLATNLEISPSYIKNSHSLAEFQHELLIFRTIDQRSKILSDDKRPRVPKVVKASSDTDGGTIELSRIRGPSPLAMGELMGGLVKDDVLSRRDFVLLALYGFVQVLEELEKLNNINIFHIDNNCENAILTKEGAFIIDFGDSEDALAETLYKTTFAHGKRLEGEKKASKRLKIYQEVEAMSTGEILISFLKVYDRNEARYALLEFIEKLLKDAQLDEEFISDFEKLVKVFTTEDPDLVKGMQIRALIEPVNAFIDQYVGKPRFLKKPRVDNTTNIDTKRPQIVGFPSMTSLITQ